MSKNESAALLAGTEYTFREMGTVRLGFDNSHLAFGAGLNYSFMHIDYSFGSINADGALPPTHRFSITFDIGKSREEMLLIAEEARKRREKELVDRTKEQEKQNFITEHTQKGKEYLDQNRYFDAYAEFQGVVSVDPFNKPANALLDSTDRLIQKDFENRQQAAMVKVA